MLAASRARSGTGPAAKSPSEAPEEYLPGVGELAVSWRAGTSAHRFGHDGTIGSQPIRRSGADTHRNSGRRTGVCGGPMRSGGIREYWTRPVPNAMIAVARSLAVFFRTGGRRTGFIRGDCLRPGTISHGTSNARGRESAVTSCHVPVAPAAGPDAPRGGQLDGVHVRAADGGPQLVAQADQRDAVPAAPLPARPVLPYRRGDPALIAATAAGGRPVVIGLPARPTVPARARRQGRSAAGRRTACQRRPWPTSSRQPRLG